MASLQTLHIVTLVLVLVATICTFSTAATATPDDGSNKKFRFALVAKWATHPFFLAAQEGCMVGALELGDHVECVFVGPTDSPDGYEQEQIMRALVDNQQVDGIAVSVGLPHVMRDTLNRAVASGIPVVTFDSDDPQSDRIAYIGTDNTFFGEQLGKTLDQLHPEGGTFGVIGSFHDAPNLHERMVGLRHELLHKANSDAQGHWVEADGSPFAYNATDIDAAFDQMEYFAKQNVTAIVPVQVGPMAYPERWKAFRNLHPQITLVNADDLDFQLILLSHRYVDGLVGQLPFEMALLSMKALHKLVQNQTLESDVIGTNLLVHLKVPLVLPELQVDDSRIDQLRIMGFVFFGLTTVASLAACGWTYTHRHVRVVHASQPIFLYMVAAGILILGGTIIPLSFDDGGHEYDDRGNLDLSLTADKEETRRVVICMSVPWCALMGFSLVFASLFSKTWRINKIFLSKSFKRVQITVRQALVPCMLVLGLNLVVLLCWTIVDPLTYTRQTHLGTDGWNRELSTFGSCQSNNVAPFILPLLFINIILLFIANWQAYQARFIESEFAESKYIAACMASLLQAVVMGVPILYMVNDNPDAFYSILVITIFLVCMVTLGVIFVPKILYAKEFVRMTTKSQDFTMKNAIRRSSVTGRSMQTYKLGEPGSSLRSRRNNTGNVLPVVVSGDKPSPSAEFALANASLSAELALASGDEPNARAERSSSITRRPAFNDPEWQEQMDQLPVAAKSFAEGAVSMLEASAEFGIIDEVEDGHHDGLRLYRRRDPVILSVDDGNELDGDAEDGSKGEVTSHEDVNGTGPLAVGTETSQTLTQTSSETLRTSGDAVL